MPSVPQGLQVHSALNLMGNVRHMAENVCSYIHAACEHAIVTLGKIVRSRRGWDFAPLFSRAGLIAQKLPL